MNVASRGNSWRYVVDPPSATTRNVPGGFDSDMGGPTSRHPFAGSSTGVPWKSMNG